ncbi:MAG: sel1 repeat family protein [Nitratireductor sp.]|nr:sel1 repeat family protein [Nitratireductor sp.]
MAYFDAGIMDFNDIASTGNAETLFELGMMYATGRNGAADIVAAHKWLNIAAFRGCQPAKAVREELAAEMSREEIARAQREAREWITRH